jgi:hypothetical protein
MDLFGAVSITVALILAVYAIVDGKDAGWTSMRTLGLLAIALVLLATFVWNEARVRAPLVPLGLLRSRNLATSAIIGILWCASLFAWFFLSALYMQRVLGFNTMRVGLAFLPANLTGAAFAVLAAVLGAVLLREPVSGAGNTASVIH